MRHSMLFCLLVISSAAFAQTKPSVAAYPLDVLVRGVSDQQVKELQSEARRLLSLEAATPDGLTLDAALVMTERKDCDVEDACLSKFAVNAKVLYAVFSSVETDLKQKQVTAKGRVVRDDGVLVVAAKTVTLPVGKKGKDAVEVAVREALKSLYAELKIAGLPVAKEVPKKDPDPLVKKDPDPLIKDPPPPPPPIVIKETNPLRIVGLVGLAGGAAAGVGGIITFATAPIVDKDPQGNVKDPTVFQRAYAQQSVGVGLMIGGFAVATAGGLLAALAQDTETVKTTVVPLPGGAAVLVGGSF